jgi:hypothetical protein
MATMRETNAVRKSDFNVCCVPSSVIRQRPLYGDQYGSFYDEHGISYILSIKKPDQFE